MITLSDIELADLALGLEEKAQNLPEGRHREDMLNLIEHGAYEEAGELWMLISKQSPIIGRHVFASSIGQAWAKLAERHDNSAALYLSWDVIFGRFRFCLVEKDGKTKTLQEVIWDEWSLS